MNKLKDNSLKLPEICVFVEWISKSESAFSEHNISSQKQNIRSIRNIVAKYMCMHLCTYV